MDETRTVDEGSLGDAAIMNRRRQTTGPNLESSLADAYRKVLPMMPRASGMSFADREDVVQDACVRVLNAGTRRAIRNPLSYLLRATRNLLIDRHRARASAANLFMAEASAQGMAVTELDPERILSDRERLEIIRSAIGKLPPRCAEALRLHRFSGLSYPAIAQRMGISCSMVEKHISEAMLRLACALQKADEPSPE
jgi:RNA polymerase sigma-70 factor (ECF subfamily)